MPARITIRQPARCGRAGDVEDPHHRQELRRTHLRDAVVVTGGDQVRADQAVGARAADEERAGENPERARLHREAKRRDRRHGARRLRRRSDSRSP